jgi:rRNA maturation endonuclease Nob1
MKVEIEWQKESDDVRLVTEDVDLDILAESINIIIMQMAEDDGINRKFLQKEFLRKLKDAMW